MNWQSLLAAVALLIVATVAGGAAFRLGATFDVPGVGPTMLLVAVALIAVVVLTVASVRRSSTPYW